MVEPVTPMKPGAARSTPFVPPGTRIVAINDEFKMWRGGRLPRLELAYESWGERNASDDNTILLFTGLSPSAHAAASEADPESGWWEFMIGPGKPLDSDRYHIICINSLGSCYGSTGPASIDPRSGEPYRLAFPELAVEDIARAADLLLGALGIGRLHTVIGTSLGGMSALAYATMFPGRTTRMINLSSAVHAHAYAIAIRSLQREIIRKDPAWLGGHYAIDAEPLEGMRLARKLGLLSYRAADEWEQRFGREPLEGSEGSFAAEFQVESYLEANAVKFVGRFDANAYLYLSRAMDRFDLAEHGGSLERAFARMQLSEALVIGVESDLLFPIEQQRQIASQLEAAGVTTRFEALASPQGHDAFLADRERFMPPLADFLG